MSKGDETRQAILDHGVALASVVGLDGITIGTLAASLKMSKSGLYGHFKSKENLQLALLQATSDRFIETVVTPAFKAPRGEPRIRALHERWIDWDDAEFQPGGCLFVTAAVELDDQPGPPRDLLRQSQRDWLDTLATAAKIAIDEGHFRPDLDVDQFAYDLYAAAFGYHFVSRLLRDPEARRRSDAMLETILANARTQPPSPGPG